MDLDSEVAKDFTRYQTLRLWIAGALALFVAGAGIVLILLDKGIYGFALLISEITALLAVFLVGRSAEDEDFDPEALPAELEDGEGN